MLYLFLFQDSPTMVRDEHNYNLSTPKFWNVWGTQTALGRYIDFYIIELDTPMYKGT